MSDRQDVEKVWEEGPADLLLSTWSPEPPSGQPWGSPLPSALPRLTQPEVLVVKVCGQQVPALLSSPHAPHISQYSCSPPGQKTSIHPSTPCPTTSCSASPPLPSPVLQAGGVHKGDWAPCPPPALSSRGGSYSSPRASM